MRIGNWLGGSVIMALAAVHGMAATARTAEHVTTVPTRRFSRRPVRRSLLRRLRSDAIRRRAPDQNDRRERSSSSSGPTARRSTNGQDIGFDQQGWYTFKVEGAKKPYSVENTFVQVAQSTKKTLELLLLAHQGRLDPRALGRRKRTRRHDERTLTADDDFSLPARAATSRPGTTSSCPDLTACSNAAAAGDDATWFPNLYDDLTWVGPDKTNGGRSPAS